MTSFVRILKTLIRPDDVTLIYAAYAKCEKMQMDGFFTAFFKEKFCKYK